MILTLLIIILTIFNVTLINFNSSIEFAICSRIPSSEGLYHMETSLPICNTNSWTGFCIVGLFSGGYSKTNSNFYFNINVNITVDSYMNSSFSHLLKNLIVFRIMKLESTGKITAKFELTPQCLPFSSLFFYIYLREKQAFQLVLFAFIYSLVRLPFEVHSLN